MQFICKYSTTPYIYTLYSVYPIHRDHIDTFKANISVLPCSSSTCLNVVRLKPHCMHSISVVVRCAVENLPEPDWQRLKPFGWQRWKRPWLEGVVLVGKASGNGRVCSRSHGLFFLEMRIVHSYLKLC